MIRSCVLQYSVLESITLWKLEKVKRKSRQAVRAAVSCSGMRPDFLVLKGGVGKWIPVVVLICI